MTCGISSNILYTVNIPVMFLRKGASHGQREDRKVGTLGKGDSLVYWKG